MADAPALAPEKVQEWRISDDKAKNASVLTSAVEATEPQRSLDERSGITRSVLEVALERPELLEKTYSGDIEDAINEAIGSIDAEISLQLDEIMHTEEFQKLEATWRGLA